MIIKKFFISIFFILITSTLYCDNIYLKKLDYQTIKIKKAEGEQIKNSIFETAFDLGFFITDISHTDNNYRISAINYLKNKGTKIDIQIKKKKFNEYLLRIDIHVKTDILKRLNTTDKGGEQAYQNFFDALENNLKNEEFEN